jgi:hypothetical protein
MIERAGKKDERGTGEVVVFFGHSRDYFESFVTYSCPNAPAKLPEGPAWTLTSSLSPNITRSKQTSRYAQVPACTAYMPG